MKRRQWDSESKAKIVMEGLRGRAVADLCNEYQINQSMYYKWRDQFMENVAAAFETGKTSKIEDRLKKENQRLKTVIGELHMELKKRLISRKGQGRGARKSADLDLARRDAELLPVIRELKADHPFWECRRIWATLNFRMNIHVNKKRIARIMRENNLTVKRAELKTKRTPGRAKPSVMPPQ